MTRIYVTAAAVDVDTYEDEPSGPLGYFTQERATRYDAATEWDGSNRIDVNTGSQWDHQELYRTAQGRWVLGHYSNRQGVTPSYNYVNDEAAQQWLIRNDEDDAARQYFGTVEEERGPGRPEIGGIAQIRLGDLLDKVDQWAAARNVNRAEAIRSLVAAGLAQ